MTPGELVARVGALGIHVHVDGDGLRYRGPRGALTPELREQLLARKHEIIELLRRMDAEASERITRVPREGRLPLSSAQHRLWFQDALAPSSPANNLTGAVILDGRLDVDALRQAIVSLVARHEAFRTRLVVDAGEPYQLVDPPWQPELDVEDLTAMPGHLRLDEARRIAAAEAERRFELARGALLRVRLLRIEHACHVLVVSVPHIVADGVGLLVLDRELATLYEEARVGHATALPEPEVQMVDYAVWQRAWLKSPAHERELAFWRDQLAGLTTIEIPSLRARPHAPSLRGAEIRACLLDAPEADVLRRIGKRAGATTYMTLLAAFAALLSRWTERADLGICSAIANRNHRGLEDVIGFFVNIVIMRLDVSGNPSFVDLVHRARAVCIDAYAHQDMPFDDLVAALHPQRQRGGNPLCRVAFAVSDTPWMPGHSLSIPMIGVTPLDFPRGFLDLDLHLWVYDTPAGITARLEYAVDLFDAPAMEWLLNSFRVLVRAAVSNPEARVSALPLVDDSQCRTIAAWNDTARLYPRDAVVHTLFEAQAAASPSAEAIRYGSDALSYEELERHANRLARHLRSRGVRRGDVVGLELQRGADLVVAMLAVLKAGAAYVPIDPAYPEERRRYLLCDVGARVVLRRGRCDDAAWDRFVINLDAEEAAISALSEMAPAIAVSANDLAYVLYTSGSTGTPKGVAVTHRAIVRLVRDTDYVRIAPNDRVAQASNSSFDAATFEIWGALLGGAALVGLSSDVVLAPHAFAEALWRERITVLFVTTALFDMIATEGPEAFGALRSLLFGGEQVHPESVRRVLERGAPERLIHVYGPTECTTFSTWQLVHVVASDAATIPIGRPIANTRAYVLDAQFRPVPPGVVGELYIGGDGVAREYVGRPAATAERFLPDPFSPVPGARMYRTGDLVRLQPDGAIVFVGRDDLQVKVRGFRVEPGEIEQRLCEHPGVAAAVVQAHADGPGKCLIAYVVMRLGHHVDAEALRAFLRNRVPEYMVPSSFVALNALPLTPNGKIDRAALTAPSARSSEGGAAYVPPRAPFEEIVAELWSDVLGIRQPSAHDDFFDLGGHSLLATRMISRLRAAVGVDVPVRVIFEAPRLVDLAARVAELRGRASALAEITRAERPRVIPPSFAQQRLWFLHRLAPDSAAYNIVDAWRLQGPIDVELLERVFTEIVRRHEALRTTFNDTGGIPSQRVHAPEPVHMDLEDLHGRAAPSRHDEARRWIRQQALRPFDLRVGPLLRVSVARVTEDEHVLLVVVHHVVADGWSMSVITREISALYEAYRVGARSPLEELGVQYVDFSLWQRRVLDDATLQSELLHWTRRLAGLQPLRLPLDRARPATPSFVGAERRFMLDASLAAQLRRLGRAAGSTLFMVLLAAFKILLHRYTAGQEDIAVGSPIANRTRGEIESLIGFFVNTLVLRTHLGADPTFLEVLASVKETALDAYAHQDLPFERLVEEMQTERDAARNPLVQVVFALHNAPRESLRIVGLDVGHLDYFVATTRFDLELHVWEEDDRLDGIAVYSPELFEDATIVRLLACYQTLLEEVVRGPKRPISRLPLLTAEERARIIARPPMGEAPRVLEASIGALFSELARRQPDTIAIVQQARRLDYRQLDERSDRLAMRLLALGARWGDTIAVCVERSPEMIVGLLGILKAGAAYVPLEARQPKARLEFFLRNADVQIVVADRTGADLLASTDRAVVVLERDDEHDDSTGAREAPMAPTPGGDAIAYVMYTSGSSGAPKGVCVPHRAVVRLVRETSFVDLSPKHVFLQYAPLAFDASNFEIWGALLNGASLVLMPPGPQSLESIAREIRERGVSTVWLTSGLFHLMVDENLPSLSGVRQLLAGGDVLSVPHVARLLSAHPECRVINGYGPTENCTFTCCHTTTQDDGRGTSIPIGTSIPHGWVDIVDRHLEPVPDGVPGELVVGGAGLALGYLKLPALTAERFLPDPFERLPGARVYRTGDLVRRRVDGAIEFLGRIDQQLKINGYRVEPGEIEVVARACPYVKDIAVIGRDTGRGDKELVCYVVPDPKHAAGEDDTAGAHVREWNALFDEHVYRDTPAEFEPRFNIVGWKSSYTGKAIPAEQMRDWLRHRVERLLKLAPRRILEVGCGTGLLTFFLAARCERYVGTDFSASALEHIANHLRPDEVARVELLHRPADDWTGLDARSFDAVVLNSVLQYFPSLDYLVSVIAAAVDAVDDGGFVFLGDIRSLPLLHAFHASVELHRAPPSMSTDFWQERVRRAVFEDGELAVDPALFAALRRRLPRVTHIEVELTRGNHDNEMARFRYSAILHVGAAPTGASCAATWLDWMRDRLDLAALRERLAQPTAGVIGVSGVPNARIAAAVQLARTHVKPGSARRVEDLHRLALVEGEEPDRFWELAEEIGWTASVAWCPDRADAFDVLLMPPRCGAPPRVRGPMPIAERLDDSRPLSSYGSTPGLGRAALRLVPALRVHLQARLPEFMIPARVVTLDALPLTANGKIDRASLPTPIDARPDIGIALVPPRTALEETIARVWKDVLRVESISMHDNFFDVGGHSLLLVQACSRIDAALGRKIELVTLFRYPSIAALAAYLSDGDRDVSEARAGIEQRAQRRREALRHAGRRRERDT
ncbi:MULTISPECIES: non-ribosomal peptide synthetase [Sorangium]|uniref:Thioester reductase n=1 Tax=Sorangium cellulosum TaxID=56 RepID=A0A4P2R770_SORCE|nr:MULTISPECIES: non-ribosomal peptide synthetase [Sorangium]AUX38591.1 thioester reductase [Sorangium cellulosum]WCQ97876.1 hypothetical protein NQZ70_10674 [Sorangium sp. Soce836]